MNNLKKSCEANVVFSDGVKFKNEIKLNFNADNIEEFLEQLNKFKETLVINISNLIIKKKRKTLIIINSNIPYSEPLAIFPFKYKETEILEKFLKDFKVDYLNVSFIYTKENNLNDDIEEQIIEEQIIEELNNYVEEKIEEPTVFIYPMLFKHNKSEMIVKFNGLQSGIVMDIGNKDVRIYNFDVGKDYRLFIPHTKKDTWTKIEDI